MNWDKNSLRTLILSIVKPLKVGKAVEQKNERITLDSLFPEGIDESIRLTSPFGFIARIPKGVTVFYDALFGSSYENISQGHIHTQRPEPIGVGESVLYSTNVEGKLIKVKITLTNDGTLNIESTKDINIHCTGNLAVNSDGKIDVHAVSDATITCDGKTNINSTGDASLNCSGKTNIHSVGDTSLSCDGKTSINSTGEIDIISANKVIVNCDEIKLGVGAVEKVLNGETFQTFFNQHQHIGNLSILTSPPVTPSNSSHLSNVVKAKK